MNHIQMIQHTMKALDGSGYDNRRLDNEVDWFVDNYSICKGRYTGNDWHNNAVNFITAEMTAERDLQKFSRNWDEKHAGEYRDQINKERYDMAESRKNEWGI